MQTLSPVDHALAAFVAIGVPVYATLTYPAFRRVLESGSEAARRSEFLSAIRSQWLVTAVVVAGVLAQGRTVATLGLTAPGTRAFALVSLASVLAAAFLAWQATLVARREEYREAVARQIGQVGVASMMPRSRAELRLFVAIAVTAGVCEEIAWRGFLNPYLASVTGLGPVAAMAIGGALFGVGHAYQGPTGMVKTGVAGVLLGGVALAGGSVLPAVFLHAVVDVQGGVMGYLVLTRGVQEAERQRKEPVAS